LLRVLMKSGSCNPWRKNCAIDDLTAKAPSRAKVAKNKKYRSPHSH
jgi:hypothetical protein